MKVLSLKQLQNTEREVKCPKGGFTSYRFLLEKDGMGFTLNKTVIPAGDKQFWHYKNHLEACYCVWGLGVLTDARTGKKHTIEPDTLYVLDDHDPHEFKALETTVLISVFNPPLKGREVHREDGSYV